MKRILFLCVALTLCLGTYPAAAEEAAPETGATPAAPASTAPAVVDAEPPALAATLNVENVRLAAPPIASRPAAIFMTIQNTGNDDQVTAVTSPTCGRAELHTHMEENGVMKMRRIDAIDLPAGQVTTLKPMSLHIMCFDPVLPLNVGNSFNLTLALKSGASVNATGHIVSFSDIMAETPAQPVKDDTPMIGAPAIVVSDPKAPVSAEGDAALPGSAPAANMAPPSTATPEYEAPVYDDFHQHDTGQGHPAL